MMDLHGRRWFLTLALAGWLTLTAGPLLAESDPATWLDHIVQQIQDQKNHSEHPGLSAVYDRYLAQVQEVRYALVNGDRYRAREGMSRLIEMVATKQGEIPNAVARSLLLYIGMVTPVEYLDDWARSHLRLLMESIEFETEEIPAVAPFGMAAHPRHLNSSQWGWIENRAYRPIIVLGAGVVLLTAAGAVVLLLIWLTTGSPTEGGPRQLNGRDGMSTEGTVRARRRKQDAA